MEERDWKDRLKELGDQLREWLRDLGEAMTPMPEPAPVPVRRGGPRRR